MMADQKTRDPPAINLDAQQAIYDIIRRGNDVQIRRKGDGYIILEIKKTIKYSSGWIGSRKGQ